MDKLSILYWQVINHLEIWTLIKLKQEFFQVVAMPVLLYGLTTYTFYKMLGKKLSCLLQKVAACCFEQILQAALYKQQLYSHLPPII